MSTKYWNEQIETASREQLNKLQLERLQKTVKHVYDNVPLYRERMDAAGIKPEDVKA